jgi:hypothetical protein
MYYGRYSREVKRWIIVWPSPSSIISTSHYGLVPEHPVDQSGGQEAPVGEESGTRDTQQIESEKV